MFKENHLKGSHLKKKAADVIRIAPQSKRHQLFLLVLGIFLFSLSLLLNSIFWQHFRFQLMLLMFASFIVLVTAITKLTEPQLSYQLTRKKLTFLHRFGQWQVKWSEIVRLGKINAQVNYDYVELPYLGIRLKSLQTIAEQMSPRLANRLIHEQQELLVLAAKNKDIILEHGLISFEPYILEDKTYKGPVAAWLFRCEQLMQAYGYHLFLPESSFDRELSPFHALLTECHQYAKKTAEDN